MTDTPSDVADGSTEQHPSETDADVAAVSSTYKVLGELGDPSGAGVLGKNTADSGTPVGVEGTTPNADGYGLSTPDDARIGGAIDTAENDHVVNAGTTATEDARNVLLGHDSNTVYLGVVGATVAGGGFDDGTINARNIVTDNYGTVGGGRFNRAGNAKSGTTDATYATVGGGRGNKARGQYATVSGGQDNVAYGRWATVGGGGGPDSNGAAGNTASDDYATVAGGRDNLAGNNDGDLANGQYATVGGGKSNGAHWEGSTVAGGKNNVAYGNTATVGGGESNQAAGNNATVPGGTLNHAGSDSAYAAGKDAKAADAYSHVWNDGSAYHDIRGDSTKEGLSSSKDVAGSGVTGNKTFHVSAQGGIRFITGSSAVTYVSSSSTGWSVTSTRAAKTNVDPVDPGEALDGVEDLEVTTWEYEDDGEGAGTTHIGPMAEEFHDAFDVGDSDRHINSINADGVALAAIQGLARRLDEEKAALERENERLREQLSGKDERIDALDAETDRLRDRLAALESRVGVADD